MRLIGAASLVFLLALGFASSSLAPTVHAEHNGQAIFRFDTFGDEQLWTNVLRMHEVIPNVDPATALCHSTVDNSFAPGIGHRLDGWANTSLNVGAIVALSPALDEATKAAFRSWGPGMYDPRHHAFNGTNIIPLNSPTIPVVIPPIYGLKGVGFETYTADGPISYWNSYVGVGQMGGHGNFSDPRIGLTITQSPDLVTPKLPALLDYQLSLKAPRGSAVRQLPPQSRAHRRAARTRQSRPAAPRSGGSRAGPGVRRAHRDGPVPDHATAGVVPAYRVLPRRQRGGPDGGRQSLRHAVQPAPHGGAEGGSRRVPEVAVTAARQWVVVSAAFAAGWAVRV
jgi:hypothetical protein